MAQFRRIVRAGENRDITPPRRIHTAYKTEPELVELEIGRNASGKTFSGSSSATTTLYMDTKLKESRLQGRFV